MSTLNLRPAKDSDLPSLSSLLNQVHAVHAEVRPDLFRVGGKKYTDEEVLSILSNPRTPIFVAEKEGQVLGYAFCIHQEHPNDTSLTDVKTLYIDDLCVSQDARGQHIGTALYNYVSDYAKQSGYYNLTLNVWADNKKALGFYESLDLHVQKIGMEKIL